MRGEYIDSYSKKFLQDPAHKAYHPVCTFYGYACPLVCNFCLYFCHYSYGNGSVCRMYLSKSANTIPAIYGVFTTRDDNPATGTTNRRTRGAVPQGGLPESRDIPAGSLYV